MLFQEPESASPPVKTPHAIFMWRHLMYPRFEPEFQITARRWVHAVMLFLFGPAFSSP